MTLRFPQDDRDPVVVNHRTVSVGIVERLPVMFDSYVESHPREALER
jgi:hypothetical protein